MPSERPIYIASRGSALALAQSRAVLAQCRAACTDREFEIKIIKTTGDKLQTAAMSQPSDVLAKGLFTKELEVALLNHEADFAVHSLKDLPTELPEGLKLLAVCKRADVRDVLVYRDSRKHQKTSGAVQGRGFAPHQTLKDFPPGLVVATSSTRRQAQLLAVRPDFKTVLIRGNVATRLHKLADQPEMDATLLAAAGLERLYFQINADGQLLGEGLPDGLLAARLSVEEMLPCVGQAAIGLEGREHDEAIAAICARINHAETLYCVTAERSFLREMGGGCQAPMAALGEVSGDTIHLQTLAFVDGVARRASGSGPLKHAADLGAKLARQIKQSS